MNVQYLEPYLYTLEDFLSTEECAALIQWSEQKGYEEAKVQIDGQQRMFKSIRNNSRITFIDLDLCEKIWQKFKPFAIQHYGNSEATGLNEMFRFYKYEPGQQFRRHRDGSYIRNERESSFFTLMIYLNEEFEGGQTIFENHTVKPKTGTALAFYHGMLHAGAEVTSGIKYALRTDVMYTLNA